MDMSDEDTETFWLHWQRSTCTRTACQAETLDILRSELNRLIWICRLNQVVSGVPLQLQHDEQMLLALLADPLRESPVGSVVSAMEDAGMRHALDEVPLLVFGNLRRAAIPEEDIQLLRSAEFSIQKLR